MIEINLLPQKLRVKTKLYSIESIPPKYFLYSLTSILGLLFLIHFYLVIIGITKNYQLKRLNSKWHNLKPQLEILKPFRQEQAAISVDAKLIQRLMLGRINWAEKLNKLSMHLPSGVWLNGLSLNQKDFILKAGVISLQKEELNLINRFITELKNDAGFFKDFNVLELTSVERRTVAGYDIVDFILQGKLK